MNNSISYKDNISKQNIIPLNYNMNDNEDINNIPKTSCINFNSYDIIDANDNKKRLNSFIIKPITQDNKTINNNSNSLKSTSCNDNDICQNNNSIMNNPVYSVKQNNENKTNVNTQSPISNTSPLVNNVVIKTEQLTESEVKSVINRKIKEKLKRRRKVNSTFDIKATKSTTSKKNKTSKCKKKFKICFLKIKKYFTHKPLYI